MNKTISRCLLICATAVWLVLVISTPSTLSDQNLFLKGFINHELLAFLGVLVTITLASAAQLHLALNRIEEKAKKRAFTSTRQAVKKSAYWLLWALVLGLVLVVVKPIIIGAGYQRAEALLNGFALLVILFSVLILSDLTSAAFSIEPQIEP